MLCSATEFAAAAPCVKAGRAVAPAAGSARKVQRETRKIDVGCGEFFVVRGQ